MTHMILGVDLGCSAVKVAALRLDGSILSALRLPCGRGDLSALLDTFCKDAGLAASDVEKVVLTGAGASRIGDAPDGLPVCTVDEFQAVAAGALSLSGKQSAVIVSMGTGTSFLWADTDGALRHLCGSGVGGGTLDGLCRQLSDAQDYAQMTRLIAQGDTRRVDLTIRDVMETIPLTLHPDMTASNFAKKPGSSAPADLAAGACNLVLQTIGTMSLLACQVCRADTVVLTGALTELPQAVPNFQLFEQIYGVRFLIPQHAAFAAAIGAARCGLRNETPTSHA
jgi:type II pantothenate kinase